MKRIAIASNSRKKDEDMDANTQSRPDHGSWQTPSPTPAPGAGFKMTWGPVFVEKVGWRGATREHTLQRSVTEEQRSQPAFSAKTLRAADPVSPACAGSGRYPDTSGRAGFGIVAFAAGLHGILKPAPGVLGSMKRSPHIHISEHHGG